MPELAYFPIIGRGEQIRLLAAEHKVTLDDLKIDLPGSAPMGTVPLLKDNSITVSLHLNKNCFAQIVKCMLPP